MVKVVAVGELVVNEVLNGRHLIVLATENAELAWNAEVRLRSAALEPISEEAILDGVAEARIFRIFVPVANVQSALSILNNNPAPFETGFCLQPDINSVWLQ